MKKIYLLLVVIFVFFVYIALLKIENVNSLAANLLSILCLASPLPPSSQRPWIRIGPVQYLFVLPVLVGGQIKNDMQML